MKGKELELKWIPLNTEILKEVVRIEQTVGNYSIVQLSNYEEAILDRERSQILVSSEDWYDIFSDWEEWLNKGFIIVVSSYYDEDYNPFEGYEDDDDEYNSHVDTTYYFFSIRAKKFIAKAKDFYANAFMEGKSDYFMVRNGDWNYAIFDKNGNQISDWFDDIDLDGLVNGESDYYIAYKDFDKAIFHKSGQQISDWYDLIYRCGLVKGESDYYIAEKDNKKAVFHKDGKRITKWFDWIKRYGFVEGKSDYYLATKDGKSAIFHKDRNQISDWLDGEFIMTGLFLGISDFYVVKGKDNLYYIHKLGSKKVMGPIEDILDYGFIEDPSRDTVIVETSTYLQKIFTKQELEQFFEEKDVENER
jgi:predicted enzyme related to lactoylglutathione lyase